MTVGVPLFYAKIQPAGRVFHAMHCFALHEITTCNVRHGIIIKSLVWVQTDTSSQFSGAAHFSQELVETQRLN